MTIADSAEFDSALAVASTQQADFHTELEQLPVSQRFDAWYETLTKVFYPFDMSGESSFCIGHLVMKDVGLVRAGLMKSDAVNADRGRRHLSQRGGDFINISMPINGVIRLEQRGNETTVLPGDMGFVVTSDCYSYRQPECLNQLVLRIPTAAMRERFPGIEDLSARRLSRQHAPVSLFLDYAGSFCAHASRFDDVSAGIASNYLLELFAFALTSTGGSEGVNETTVKIAHMRRAIQYIEANLDDPELAVRQVAHAVNVSERYLQRLFAERGDTVTGFIRNRRVVDAKRLLKDCASQSIASIGYRVGFRDPSHFSRLFREAVGQSPRDYRHN